jgi:uncharacterized protein YjbJ (UPF0337 family)
MNSDELKGKMENLKGRARQALGTLTGNKKEEAEGIADRVEGAAREKVGEVKDAADKKRHQYDDVEETDDE